MDEETLAVEIDDDEAISSSEPEEDDKSEKSVSSDLIRGHINTIILRALYDGDKYGYEIIAEIERKSSGQYSLKQPSLYSALKRLEKDGYITSYWGGSVGGGRRKYFSLTDEGKAVSEQNQAEWEYSRTIIDSLISDRDFDFNRPAPTAVDMSVLRRSTSRVPSREGDEDDGEEFSFEPAFDDTALREKLEEETRQKQAELEEGYEEKRKALEEEYAEKVAALDRERADFEAEKARLEEEARQKQAELEASYEEKHKALEEEYAEKVAALDLERADFEAEKTRLEDEMNAREREVNDSYAANLRQLAIIREQQEAALQQKQEEAERQLAERQTSFDTDRSEQENSLAEQRSRLLSEREALDGMQAELQAEREAFEKEKSEQSQAKAEADEDLKNQLDLQIRKNAEEAEEHERALQLLKEANEQALIRAQQSSEATLQAEKARHNEILNEERNRYNAALAEETARHEAQIRDDRMRYQQALDDQIAALRKQMELQMAQREQEIIHRNFISLVNSPASQPQPYVQQQPAPSPEDPPKAQSEDYRSTVGRLYENTVRPTAKVTEEQGATPVSGIDFRDIQKRATRDGLRVETVGGETAPAAGNLPDDVNTVHKGKALFLSSIVVFFWCVLVGGITMGLRGTLTLPVFYPYLMWGFGLVLLLTTGLMYANHFGANRLRNPSLAFINSIVIYALIDIVALIVALSVRIDFSDTSQLMTFVLLPAIYFVAVLIFGICYYLQVKPKK